MKRKNNEISIISKIQIEDTNYYILFETLFSHSEFIDFYKKTYQSFSKSALQEFIKEFRRKLEQKYESHSFQFIKKTYSSLEQLQKMFIEIANYCKNHQIGLNIWDSFIKTKIKEYIETKQTNIFDLMQKDDTNIIYLYTILDKLFTNDRLISFVNFKEPNMKKLKLKKDLEEYISNNHYWVEYFKYICKIKEIDEGNKDQIVCQKNKKYKSKSSTKKLFTSNHFNKLNEIYTKQILNIYFKKMIKFSRECIRNYHRSYIDQTIKNMDHLCIYIKLINLNKN